MAKITHYVGHSSIEVTFDRYGHLVPGNEAEAVALIDAYLERANTLGRLTALEPAILRHRFPGGGRGPVRRSRAPVVRQ
jgi:hypothetical protein